MSPAATVPILVHPHVNGSLDWKRNAGAAGNKYGQILRNRQKIVTRSDGRVILEALPRITAIRFVPPSVVIQEVISIILGHTAYIVFQTLKRVNAAVNPF